MTITLAELLKDTYKLTQFKPAQIAALEASITLKDSGKKPAPYIHCLVRGKPIKLTPEEAVRQLYIMVLKDDLGYPVSRMELEYGVTFGRENWMWWMKHSSTSSTKAARARKGSISRRAM